MSRLLLRFVRVLFGWRAVYDLTGAVFLRDATVNGVPKKGVGDYLIEPFCRIGYGGIPNRAMVPVNFAARVMHWARLIHERPRKGEPEFKPLYVLNDFECLEARPALPIPTFRDVNGRNPRIGYDYPRSRNPK